ncbi:MAG: hypothetical protein QHH15_00280 [Candidatus Thermoplasmatota archaeon]|nr:hypothetical protein [Candidatus Thermoplasmatota archaeon]
MANDTDYDMELEEDTKTSYNKTQKKEDNFTSELTVLLLFMATSAIFAASPKGYKESNMVKMALDLLKEEGYNLKDLTQITKSTISEDAFKIMQNSIDRQGQWAYHEGTMQGQLSEYMVYDVRMIWNTCEDNGNCATDGPVCDDCESYSGMEFTVNEFPPAPHDFCRCNEPEIEIYVVERFNEKLF